MGLDLGKSWVHMVGLDESGRIVLRRRVKRHLDRVVLLVEIVSGNKHDGNFQADLLDACYEN